ncbi:unnamed protein product [Ilex paraguariensis]|uniref:Uncharacterized protein n=1 Tax=Ilex paraguariensis TaxID=185542 RepID=A0ABC8RXJ2_9AQUA
MENKKQVGSSKFSSFTTDLFGAKDSSSPPSSTGIFASIFPPPSTVVGRNSSNSELIGYKQRQSSGSQAWNAKQGTADYMTKNSEGASSCAYNKERSPIFQERVEPCPLSSSLYYGGQEDMYVQSSSAQTSASYPPFKKDGAEDDPNGNSSYTASRGNWWQGSLYY